MGTFAPVRLRRMNLQYDFLMEAIAEATLPYFLIGTEDGCYNITDVRSAQALVESGLIQRVEFQSNKYILVDRNLQQHLHRLHKAMLLLVEGDVTRALEAQVALVNARKALQNSEMEFWTPKTFGERLDKAEAQIGSVMRRILENKRQSDIKNPEEIAQRLKMAHLEPPFDPRPYIKPERLSEEDRRLIQK